MSSTIVTRTIFCLTLVGALSANSTISLKKSYICPADFVRLSHKCYYFSNDTATWQEAYFHCQSKHSNLAIIKNTNQDKLIRKVLSNLNTKQLERWIGGRFDWQKKEWKWAASGKNLIFNSFHQSVNKTDENLQWSCIIMDPQFQYKWNYRSCLEEKHFICHKKVQSVIKPGRKSRRKQLRNDIPIPDIPNDIQTNSTDLQKILPARSVANMFQIDVNTKMDPNFSPPKLKKRYRRKRRRNNLKKPSQHPIENQKNHTSNGEYKRNRRNKIKEDEIPKGQLKIHYRTYKEGSKNPFYPRPIVEEFNLDKA